MAETDYDYSKEGKDHDWNFDYFGRGEDDNNDDNNDYDDLVSRYKSHKETHGDDTLSSAPSVPDSKEMSGIKRSETAAIKNYLKDKLGVSIRKGDGKSSEKLINSIKIFTDKVTGRENLYYQDKLVGSEYDGKFNYSSEKIVDVFKENLRAAVQEHAKTAMSVVEERLGPVEEDSFEIMAEDALDEIEERIKKIQSESEQKLLDMEKKNTEEKTQLEQDRDEARKKALEKEKESEANRQKAIRLNIEKEKQKQKNVELQKSTDLEMKILKERISDLEKDGKTIKKGSRK